tara:strand:+ start:208 stop:396 length:189 start_codon:yes stop_codon:yes gene_type:complete
MTDQEVFNTFSSVLESQAKPFYYRLAQAALIATPDDKAKILRTWPEFVLMYGPNTSLYKEAA